MFIKTPRIDYVYVLFPVEYKYIRQARSQRGVFEVLNVSLNHVHAKNLSPGALYIITNLAWSLMTLFHAYSFSEYYCL